MARTQFAALPYKLCDGELRVMLVTSRETRRWIIPKGWPEKALEPHALAAREAFEEAGLVGIAAPTPIGFFQYEKRLKTGKTRTCKVAVYPLEVEYELADWPETGQRERRWFSPSEAALLVQEGGLISLLLHIAAPTP